MKLSMDGQTDKVTLVYPLASLHEDIIKTAVCLMDRIKKIINKTYVFDIIFIQCEMNKKLFFL